MTVVKKINFEKLRQKLTTAIASDNTLVGTRKIFQNF